MTNLLLVGSDHVFRQALAIVLEHSLPGCRVCGQASTIDRALTLLSRDSAFDLAIVDLDERLGDPAHVVRGLLRQRPGLVVLGLIDGRQEPLVSQLCMASVALILEKSASLEVILEGVRQLGQPPEAQADSAASVTAADAPPHESRASWDRSHQPKAWTDPTSHETGG